MKTSLVWILVLVGWAGTAQALPIFGLTSLLPVDLTVSARDLAQIADAVVAKQVQCAGQNAHGRYTEGGGCNRYGCWTAGGSCNEFGCSLSGACTEKGCDSKIESFQCENSPSQGI